MHVFSSPPTNKSDRFLECRLCVCLSIRVRLAPERLDGFCSYSVFEGLPVRHRCPTDVNVLTLKVGGLHRGPQTQNCDWI
jgi:hypothetical protein